MRTLTYRIGAALASALAIAVCALTAQAHGFDCEYTVTSNPPLAPAGGGVGSFSISTGAACAWTVSAFTRVVDPETGEITSTTTTTWVHDLDPASGAGTAVITYIVDPNPASDTRSTYIGVSDVNTGAPAVDIYGYEVKVMLAQSGATPVPAPAAWKPGDLFAGLGSAVSNRGTYRVFTPAGPTATQSGPDLHDPFVSAPVNDPGGVTTGCMVDPTGAHDLWTSSWDGLRLSRFSDATHQLTATLDLSPAGLATMQRKDGTVPVPLTTNDVDGLGHEVPDIAFSEQFVFAGGGEFYVGTSYFAGFDHGLGYAYLLKFAKNDDGSIAGCGAAGPCLLDWWRVDAGAEQPAGQSPARAHTDWTKAWKDGYRSVASGEPESAKIAAAQASVAPLASTVSYHPSQASGQALFQTSGIDEIDLSSDGLVYYTSEDGYIRRVDPASGDQGDPIQISSDVGPISGKAYGFRILPDGAGGATGSAGFIVAMGTRAVLRLDANGQLLKPFGYAVYEPPDGWGSTHPFALNLAPDAQSFWVATSQDDSSDPDADGATVYRFHIATQQLLAQFNPAPGGKTDVQGLCVKLEYLAGVNQCYATNPDGTAVLVDGQPAPVECRRATVCRSPGIDDTGRPNTECYPPGETPLALEPRSNFEGDAVDLDLRPLTPGYHISSLAGLPSGLAPVLDAGVIVGVAGTVSYGICAGDSCAPPFTVNVGTVEGASTSFVWTISPRNGPPAIASMSPPPVRALSALIVPTPVSDPDGSDALLLRTSARVYDAAHGTWISGIAIDDYGLHLSTSSRIFPATGGLVAIVGNPIGYPRATPAYPTTFEITVDVFDCDNGLVDSFTPATDLNEACFHHAATTFTLTVYGVPSVSIGNQSSQVNVQLPSPVTPTASSTPAGLPLTYEITGLPAGLTYSTQTGAITGTPVATGTSTVTVKVTQPAGPGIPSLTSSATTTFTWLIYAIGTLAVQNQTTVVNASATYQPSFTGVPASQLPLVWDIQDLPVGLTFNAATGLITGTPTVTGSSVVTVNVTDALQHVVTRTFAWNVVTNRAPVCTAASATPALIWPPNHTFVPFQIQGVTDADGDPIAITITLITQDQPIDTTGDGSTPFDAIGVGTSTASVRAERTGNLRVPEDGRLYQANFSAADGKGGSCAGSVFLGVPHDQGQHSLPQDTGCRWNSTTGAQLTPCAWLHAPALTVAAKTFYEGDVVSVQIAAVDVDGTPLTYSASGLPPGLSISPSGLVSGTIAAGAAGGKASKDYKITVTASDGYGSTSATATWTVKKR